MKALVLVLALGSITAMANDKTAYIVNKVVTQKNYIHCETASVRTVNGRERNRTAIDNLNETLSLVNNSINRMLLDYTVSSLSDNELRSCVVLSLK
jgi:ABC-type hemin transport system ATPase subunit